MSGGDPRPMRRDRVTVHCPTGVPGPPFEVRWWHEDRWAWQQFPTIAQAQAYAAGVAQNRGAEVYVAPLARQTTDQESN